MRQAVLVALLALALAGAGCSGDDAAITATSTGAAATAPSTSTTIPDSATSTTATTLPRLVAWESYGLAFQRSAADGTAALSVAPTDYRDLYRGRIPEVSVLPDPRWQARIVVGHGLRNRGPYADPADPPPVVEEEWPVVAGTITIVEMPDPNIGCGPGGVATALFEDFEALAPDGTRVHLGDFEARNEHWGCLGQ